MNANTIKKMTVPAYWPVVAGAQAAEYKGVLVEVKKVIVLIVPMDMVLDMSIADEPEVVEV